MKMHPRTIVPSPRSLPSGRGPAARATAAGLAAAASVAFLVMLSPTSAVAGTAGSTVGTAAGAPAVAGAAGSAGATGSVAGAAGPPWPARTRWTVASDYVLPLPGAPTDAGSTRAELVERGVLVRAFVDPGTAWGAGHRGVDLAAASGAEVVAPRAGFVSFVGVVVDRPLIVLTHPDGRRSTLEPVVSDLVAGTTVSAGDRLGTVAHDVSTHCAPAQCVHWGVRAGEGYLDPLTLLGVYEPIVLLPLG